MSRKDEFRTEGSIRTLDEILRHHAATRPDAPALRADDRSWTYRALRDESARVARALEAEGIGPQHRVAILDRNVPEFFTFLFGASMRNAVTLAVNWRLAAPEMEYILNHSQASVLLVGAEFLGHLAQMKLETVKQVIVLGEGGGHPRYADWERSHRAPIRDFRSGRENESWSSRCRVVIHMRNSRTRNVSRRMEAKHLRRRRAGR